MPRYQIRFFACNPGKVEGTFTASVTLNNDDVQPALPDDPRNNSITSHFVLSGGEAKEIGFIVDNPFYPLLMVNTLLSDNRPVRFTVPVFSEKRAPGFIPLNGARPLDHMPRLTAPGEFLVDNEGPGFEILPGPEPSPLRKLLNAKSPEGTELHESGWWYKPPKIWRTAVSSVFYGPVKKTAHVIAAGKGKSGVCWTADLPEPGRYEVFFHSPDTKKGFPMPFGKIFAMDFHFRVRHEEGTEEREADLQNREEGWISLGTYPFPKGHAMVELSDKSEGTVVFADAVKWVKR